MNNMTLVAIFGTLATIVLFYRGLMAFVTGEITVRARHTRPYLIGGKKAVVIGAGLMAAAVFMGLAFYFGVTTHSTKEPVGYLIIGAFGSAMLGLFVSIFVEGTSTRQ